MPYRILYHLTPEAEALRLAQGVTPSGEPGWLVHPVENNIATREEAERIAVAVCAPTRIEEFVLPPAEERQHG